MYRITVGGVTIEGESTSEVLRFFASVRGAGMAKESVKETVGLGSGDTPRTWVGYVDSLRIKAKKERATELLPFWGWVPASHSDLVSFESELDVVCDVLKKELLELAHVKGTLYQDETGVDSCLKRGFAGLYHNLARKWDRIEAVGIRLGFDRAEAVIASEAALDVADPETLYTTVRDLAVYTIHTLRWLRSGIARKREVRAE